MSDQAEPRPNLYNRLGGIAGIVMMVCWLTLVPMMFVIATATANNNMWTVIWGARIAQGLLLGGLVCLVLTIAFYAIGTRSGGD